MAGTWAQQNLSQLFKLLLLLGRDVKWTRVFFPPPRHPMIPSVKRTPTCASEEGSCGASRIPIVSLRVIRAKKRALASEASVPWPGPSQDVPFPKRGCVYQSMWHRFASLIVKKGSGILCDNLGYCRSPILPSSSVLVCCQHGLSHTQAANRCRHRDAVSRPGLCGRRPHPSQGWRGAGSAACPRHHGVLHVVDRL